MATPEQQGFIDDVLNDAHRAASHLGLPVSVVLAQWIDETGWGTSEAWRRGNNYAGVSFLEPFQVSLGAHLGDQGEILFYPSRADGLAGYIARWGDSVYGPTRECIAHHHGDAIASAQCVEESPWAASHYGGHGLRSLIVSEQLTRYDTGGAPAPPPTEHEPPCGALRPGPPPHGHPLLKIGMRGPAVADLQLLLFEHGHAPLNSWREGRPDGIFGPETTQAVADFQTAHGLHRDGIVGRQTYCALGIR